MLNFREKVFIFTLILVIFSSLIFWSRTIYLGFTRPVPKFGGEYVEGIVGQPIYINPLLSHTTAADSDLTSLVYSGLFKHDENGRISTDLAESYSISEDRKTYTVQLRRGVKWHDGVDFNVEDVIFTFDLIKNPSYKSIFRQNWQGVEITRLDDYSLKFELKNPYFGFLDSLTIGILPKHVWQEITAESFSLAERNLRPIGTGPYMFSDFHKDANGNIVSYKLSAFKEYYKGSPYISKINFNFYPDEDVLIEDFNKKEVAGMSNILPGNLSKMKSFKTTEVRQLIVPRYFALFPNPAKSLPLSYDEVRRALSISVNRQEIVDKILYGKGFPLYSPILPQMNGYVDLSQHYAYNPEEAKKILEEAGWKIDEQEKIRKKGEEKLEFEIVTTDWPEIVQSAEILKAQWEALGIRVNLKFLTNVDFQQNYIKTREYQSILFGQELNFNPDLYSFWHSENKRDPGLNLSLFENREADELMLSSRQETDEIKRADELKKIVEIIKEKNPAIFLYGYYYLYPISKSVQGIKINNVNSPSDRFSNVNEWYVKTKRVWK